jgi:hypothetical protein
MRSEENPFFANICNDFGAFASASFFWVLASAPMLPRSLRTLCAKRILRTASLRWLAFHAWKNSQARNQVCTNDGHRFSPDKI